VVERFVLARRVQMPSAEDLRAEGPIEAFPRLRGKKPIVEGAGGVEHASKGARVLSTGVHGLSHVRFLGHVPKDEVQACALSLEGFEA
jgi:hypothetical protein